MRLVLLLLFVLVPLAELYAIITVGQQIGALPTIGLLILSSIAGTVLLRQQGRAAWRRLTQALAAGRVPARETVDGALIVLGGAFLLTPGFLTDVAGLLLLIPPSRATIRVLLLRAGMRSVLTSMTRPSHQGGGAGYDVDGTATEVDGSPPTLTPRSGPS